MKNKILIVLLALALADCKVKQNAEQHEEHEEVKIQYTAYTTDFELFAEADAFVVEIGRAHV